MRSWRWRRLLWVVPAVALAAVLLVAWVRSPRTARYEVPRRDVEVPRDAAALARGKYLSEAVLVCVLCHGENLGGRLAFEHPVLGRGYTPNLTSGRGGIGARYDVSDWVRALRHGVDQRGRGLLFMPVDHYRHLSDEDLGAMIAYYRSLPPVDNERTALELSLPARLMIDLGLSGEVVRAARVDHAAPPPPRPTDEGAYLVELGGCTFCHGADLRGGQGLEPGAPPGPDLTRSGRVATFRFETFARVMRTGILPEGRAIDPRFMPWVGYARMTDADLRAILRHLQSLAPVAAR